MNWSSARCTVCMAGVVVLVAAPAASAQNLLTNGNLDKLQMVEIVPGFFLPKPASWANTGFRTITGPYEDEMNSEPWAGPAPTPVTNDGVVNPPPHNLPDWGVFFKPFTGNATNGAATGHLSQDVLATPGKTYTMTGWAGAEQNALMAGAEFAMEFRTGGGVILSTVTLNLLPTLFVDNGQPFDYKKYTLTGTAPANTAIVRVRASMIGAMANPQGGGQAFVVDDFRLVGPCPADLNNNGSVEGGDISSLLGNWGTDDLGDINGDGIVNGGDITLLLGDWGPCPG